MLSTLIWIASLAPALIGPDGTPPEGIALPERIALIVAIDHYQHADADGAWQDLRGCVNDGRLASELLQSRFGFPRESIKTLFDEQATHEAVVRTFYDWLIARAGPETEAVFWFSGHGSLLPDASGYSGAESQGKDSSYLAYDSRQRGAAKSFDISDDEMYSLVHELSRHTSRITIITDACHSGGSVRGTMPRTVRRAAEDGQNPITLDDLKAFWPPIPFLDDGDPARAQAVSYAHLAACADDEAALEYEVADGTAGKCAHGLFTYFLSQALAAMQPGTTYEQLGRDVAARVASSAAGQHVQIEGQRNRQVFASRFEAPPPGFQGTIEGSGRIDIMGGSLQQVRRGSLLDIVGVKLEPIGKAKVTDVRLTSSTAAWVGVPPRLGDEVVAVRAIEVDRPSGDRAFVVLVAAGDPTRDQIASALASVTSPKIEVVRSPGAVVDYLVDVSDDGLRYQLSTVPDGITLWREPGDHATDRVPAIIDGVRGKLTSEVYYRALLKMLGSKGRVNLGIDLAPISDDQLTNNQNLKPARIEQQRTRGMMGATGQRTIVYDRPDPVQDAVTLTIRVEPGQNVNRDLYLSVLCVSDNHDVVLLTAAGESSPRVRPGSVLPVPIVVYADPNANRASEDRYLVIATSEPADFSMFESQRVLTRGGGATPDTSVEMVDHTPSPIDQAVREARTHQPTTRGVGGVSTRVDFGVATLQVVITPDKP